MTPSMVAMSDVAAAYRMLREEGIKMHSSEQPPKKDVLATWRSRLAKLVSLKNGSEREVLHPKLQAVLLELEERILIKFPQI